jgi:hypothetical protein
MKQMNKQEAIERIESSSFDIADTDLVVGLSFTKNIINQIDEPQKVTIPEFVAEWIEECKRSDWHLQKALYSLYDDEKVGNWAYDEYDENGDLISEKVDMIARAWLAYPNITVEQEKLYTVEIPNPNSAGGKLVLFKQQSTGRLILDMLNPNINKPKYLQLTEAEIKQDFDFLWQWAKEVENDTD